MQVKVIRKPGWRVAPRLVLTLFCVMSLLTAIGQAQDAAVWQPPDTLEELPVVAELPDLMQLSNGDAVASKADWELRRAEMKAMLQYYQYGHLPPRPERVVASEVSSRALPAGEGVEQRMVLAIGKTQLPMRIAVYKPPVDGRLPVIVREEHALGHIEEVPPILKRGYMFVEFGREDLDPDKPDVVGPAQQAYPEFDWATLAVWAWGAMRVVDYLEQRDDVDLAKIGIVGHSRGGKMALLAGAMDERFALVAPNGSGCGGAGCFRRQDGKVETLELITRPERFGYWFHPRLRHFAGSEDRLPIDQHFLKALVAPRALICTDAEGDLWANPAGNRVTSQAAEAAFQFLDAPNRNALHFRKGSHDLTEHDWQAILDFADWHFRGRRPQNTDRFFQFEK